MTEQEKVAREQVDQLKRELAELRERGVQREAEAAEVARMVAKQVLNDFDQNAWSRIEAYAQHHGVSLDDAFDAIATEEMAEVGDPTHHTVSVEEVTLDVAAQRLAEEQGVDYGTALSRILGSGEA